MWWLRVAFQRRSCRTRADRRIGPRTARKLLHVRWGTKGSIGLLDTRSGENKPYFLLHSKYQTTEPRFSWDKPLDHIQDHYRTDNEADRCCPFRDGVAPEEKEWIGVTDGSTLDVEPRWSPDGSLIYFLSDRDQSRCIWLSGWIALRSSLFLQPFRYITSTALGCLAGTQTRPSRDWLSSETRSSSAWKKLRVTSG
jgi:hypothetical protein